MSLVVTVAVTFALLLIVAIPIAGLAGRGRKRLSMAKVRPALGPADGQRKLDASLRAVQTATLDLGQAGADLLRLGPAYADALPLLEVFASARSSPRVYPSQWVGETNDAHRAALDDIVVRAQGWRMEWESLAPRVRAELREGADALVSWVATALDDEALRPTAHQASSFAYLDAEMVLKLERLCTRLKPAVEGFSRALRESSTNPYR